MAIGFSNNKPVGFAICTAMAAALVAGCAGQSHVASTSGGAPVASPGSFADSKDLARLEKVVLNTPNVAAARVDLAQAYLTAGRFASAATTFEDAVSLGDVSARTALGMSLAYIGSGRSSEAVTLLKQWRDTIPAGDLGLALALAGSTSEGVDVLIAALRAGQDTPKLRQNLAYAYALDGRWSEARIMAAQDVPADQLDERISTWARMGRPEDYSTRVASLLGAPVRSDPGQPVMLALGGAAPSAPQFAAAEPQPLAEPQTLPASFGDQELPPVQGGETYWNAPAQPVSEPAPATKVRTAATENSFEKAYRNPVASPVPAPAPAPVPREPALPAAVAKAIPAPAVASTTTPRTRSVAAADPVLARPVGDPTHLVQLGSFSSPENAQRAWNIYLERNPALRDHDLVITEAEVRGKRFWRVAAAGFDHGTARSMCSTVKRSGFGCFAYAKTSPLPGALPARGKSGAMLASR
ncbi:SPOR domain-containing protein [Novosphingobium aquimarinum]|uniref:SPOR domain-containing protein n=1 Tax=Novosphingobium aquimarinum TaxID=2682494 RepID=UPI001E50444A|nr:SPOR domain-containing protein [Novosphingobium aquimarinum]